MEVGAVASLAVVVVVVVNWMEASELEEASSFFPLAFVVAPEAPWPSLTK